VGIGNGKAGIAPRVTDNGERMYPFTVPVMGIKAAPEAVVERHLQRYVQAVAEAQRHVTGGDWLDVACGSGYGSSVVKKANPNSYHGVDYSPTAIEYAREVFGQNGTYQQADITDWVPAPLKWFDAVLCIETLEHLPRCRQRNFVVNSLNLLTVGGVMVITCPVGDGGQSANPWHEYEPTLHDLTTYIGSRLDRIYTEDVEGTFGPFRQAYAVAVWR